MIDKAIGLLLIAISICPNLIEISAAAGQSQTKPVDQKDLLRLRTELIQLQVVVTDKEGRAIEGLKKEDFELMEQGRIQEVSFFSEDRLATPIEKKGLSRDQVTTQPADRARPEKPVRSIVLFVDTFHLSSPNLLRVRQTLKCDNRRFWTVISLPSTSTTTPAVTMPLSLPGISR